MISVSQLSSRLEEAIENEARLDGAEYDTSFREMFAVRKSNTECLFFRFLHKIALSEKDRLGNGSVVKLSVSSLFYSNIVCFCLLLVGISTYVYE